MKTFNHCKIIALICLLKSVNVVESAKCQFSSPRTIKCADTQISEAIPEINQIASDYSLSELGQLTFQGTQFDNDQIQRGWLSNVAVPVVQLNIENSTLSTIQSRSFSGSPFGPLLVLILTDTNIDTITSGTFQDSKLTNIGISFNTFHPISVEENAFGSLQTLRSLGLQKCVTHDAVLNMTGPNAEIPSLISLTLSSNDISELSGSSFAGVKNLKVLYISGSKIKSIEQGAFDPPMLERLDISSNELTTLPKNLFRYVRGGITIVNNKWHCDCDLVWLKDMFHYYPYYFSHRSFFCSTPDGDLPYQDVDFCPN
ncbi:leucine-rich repeat-containing protein 4C-like [Zophobas morio]|uniref:leucine-rich repeat-containing protein 4C-like n=1 Tax=Zophobas morio TaxID=2755281 RepID=UPI0030837E27